MTVFRHATRLLPLDNRVIVRSLVFMSALDYLDWRRVREHYDQRVDVQKRVLRLYEDKLLEPFVKLLLGVGNSMGNFSAAEHGLGPKILSNNLNAYERVYELATRFRTTTRPREVPRMVRAAGLMYLAVGVGSEASCMINPSVCWIANTCSIWTHLVIKHADNFGKANEELKLYREADPSSEMAYAIWAEIHTLLETSMTRIAKEGAARARAAGVEPGGVTFLWADAIADQLYVEHHDR